MHQNYALAINDSQNNEKLFFASWLAEQLAPTIRGSKPATLLTLSDNNHWQLLHWWNIYAADILGQTPLEHLVLFQCHRRITVLFYQRHLLLNCLARSESRALLESLGYPVNQGLDACLCHLAKEFAKGCPHEIGLMLGIPLKDVLGFMGLSAEPLVRREQWCIYGNPEQSLAIMRQYCKDKNIVAGMLRNGACPYAIMSALPAPSGGHGSFH